MLHQHAQMKPFLCTKAIEDANQFPFVKGGVCEMTGNVKYIYCDVLGQN